MAQRAFVLAAVSVLAAACSSTPRDDAAPDANEGGANVRDVSSPDADAIGADASDVSLTDVGDGAPVGVDARDGSRDARDADAGNAPDGEGGARDGEGGAADGDGDPLDGEASAPDADVSAPDGDGGAPDGDGGPLGCEWTSERLFVTVTLPNGTVEDCTNSADAGSQGLNHRLLSGVVRDSSIDGGMRATVAVDTCAGDVCGPPYTLIDVSTPTPFTIPVGAYVEAEYWLERTAWTCTGLLRISNLPTWNGRMNPVSDVAKTYLVVSDGLRSPSAQTASTGITVSTFALGCPVEAGSCGPSPLPVDSYAFEFSASGSAPLRVPMGQTLPWTVNGQSLSVRNHRSFQSNWCDDYSNWAFSIIGQ